MLQAATRASADKDRVSAFMLLYTTAQTSRFVHFHNILSLWACFLSSPPSRWSLTRCEHSGICFISCVRVSWAGLCSNAHWKTRSVLWLKLSNQKPLWRSAGMPVTHWEMLSGTPPCHLVSVYLWHSPVFVLGMNWLAQLCDNASNQDLKEYFDIFGNMLICFLVQRILHFFIKYTTTAIR